MIDPAGQEIDLDQTSDLLILTAHVKSDDVSAWQDLYGRKRLSLPAGRMSVRDNPGAPRYACSRFQSSSSKLQIRSRSLVTGVRSQHEQGQPMAVLSFCA